LEALSQASLNPGPISVPLLAPLDNSSILEEQQLTSTTIEALQRTFERLSVQRFLARLIATIPGRLPVSPRL